MGQLEPNGGPAPASDSLTLSGPRPRRARSRVSYVDAGSDLEGLGGRYGEPPSKRQRSVSAQDGRKLRQVPEAELESRTAWAVGLNGVALSEEEQNLLPAGTDESAYIQVGIDMCNIRSDGATL